MFQADRPSWRDPRILTILILVFVSGALAGAITVRTGLLAKPTHRAAYWRGGQAQFSYEELKKELNLTADQSERLKTILDDFAKYHDDLEAQIDDVRATGRNRILQMLTPEQRKRFEQLSSQILDQ